MKNSLIKQARGGAACVAGVLRWFQRTAERRAFCLLSRHFADVAFSVWCMTPPRGKEEEAFADCVGDDVEHGSDDCYRCC